MLGNVLLDTAGGSVPLLGSIFDVYFKANNRNIKLPRRHLQTKWPTLLGGGSALLQSQPP
nr:MULTISPECIES: DUF4112 domain-containing protein [Mesorhizobium]